MACSPGSWPGAQFGTTTTTTSVEPTAAWFGKAASRLSSRVPLSIGRSGTRTHSPRASAVMRPSSRAPERTVTSAPGLARPAITAVQLRLMRTTSKLGGTPGASDRVAAGAGGAGGDGAAALGRAACCCGAGGAGGAAEDAGAGARAGAGA
jgi:hypothetical protein